VRVPQALDSDRLCGSWSGRMSAWWTARGRDEQLRVNRVERLVVEQWELLRTLRLRALLADPDCFGSTLEAEQGRPEGFWRESLRDKVWFVAMDSGQPGGLVACVTVPGRDGERQLDAMWVEPATRGRGLGEALVRAVLDRPRAGGGRRGVADGC
jgi:ribosomal protein S18 acetylase RimI-like enzyme